jgi:NDP-sugar pyrophosphorylase family protein
MANRLSGAILAAGRGERLRGAVDGVPKPLVMLGDETLLARQANAMVAMGARPVLGIINSETAQLIEARALSMPKELELCVRDTPNSMESLFALGERFRDGQVLAVTVDAVMDFNQFRRFVGLALELTDPASTPSFDGALGVVRWRGDRKPLFADVAPDATITHLGDEQTSMVTAGVYLLPSRVFDYVQTARTAGLGALRQFLATLITRGMRFGAIELKDVIDVDDETDLNAARAMLAKWTAAI